MHPADQYRAECYLIGTNDKLREELRPGRWRGRDGLREYALDRSNCVPLRRAIQPVRVTCPINEAAWYWFGAGF